MQSLFSIGDLAESTAGRDKGKIYLLIKVEEDTAYCVNGRDRKIDNPKKKKIKSSFTFHTLHHVAVRLYANNHLF